MIIGRDHECDAIEAALDATAHGRPSSLLIVGDPGIGKTTLLDHARESAQSFTALTSVAVEAESDFPFAGLDVLLRPLLSSLARIPEVQSNALGSALALSSAQGDAPMAVGAGVLSVLTLAATEKPVVCLIDDAHWLDQQTLDALRFAVRRLRSERVALIMTTESGDFGWPREIGERLELTGIRHDNAIQLLLNQHPDLVMEVAESIVRLADGNPAVLLEAANLLTDSQRSGAEPLPTPIPLSVGVPQAIARKLDALSEPGKHALLCASVAGTGTYRIIAEGDDGAVEGISEVEQAGLVKVREGTIQFTHRLTPASVYAYATPEERRQAHLQIARALTSNDHHRDRRASHLAAAAAGPDSSLAQELADAAKDLVVPRGHGAASSLYETAARLTEDPGLRFQRTYQGARSAWLAGNLHRAQSLVERLEEAPTPSATAQADALVVQLRVQRGLITPGRAEEIACRIAESADVLAAIDPDAAVGALLLAARLARDEAAVSYTDHAMTVASNKVHQMVATVGRARTFALSRRYEESQRAMDSLGTSSWVDLDCRDDLLFEAVSALSDGCLSHAAVAAELLRDLTVKAGSHTTVAIAPAQLAKAHQLFYQGRWEEALVQYFTAASTAQETEQWHTAARAQASLALITRLRSPGDTSPDTDPDHMSSHLTPPSPITKATLAAAQLAEGGDTKLLDGCDSESWEQIYRWLPPQSFTPVDVVEFATRLHGAPAGRAELERRQSVILTPVEERLAEAVVTDDYDSVIGAVLHSDRSELSAFTRAKAQLYLGERRRRDGSRADAREPLREALTVFSSLGAHRWSTRARRELTATGATARAIPASGGESLTPQELQVARVIAGGATYKEAAAQLYLSPKTIEFHLSKVYRKLGITSRRELTGRLEPTRGER